MTDWGTDAITRELGGAGKGFDVTLAALADAADVAERAAEHAVGFPGMAAGIRDIKAKVEADRHQVQALAEQIAPLTAMVEAITADSAPSQVATTLGWVLDELDERAVATMRTNVALGETEMLIRRNLEGGQPQHLLYRVGKARSVMNAIRGRLDKAKAATEAVLANAHQAGTAEQGGAAGGVPGRAGRAATVVRQLPGQRKGTRAMTYLVHWGRDHNHTISTVEELDAPPRSGRAAARRRRLSVHGRHRGQRG